MSCQARFRLLCPATVSPVRLVRRLARKRRSAGEEDPLPLSLSYKVHIASVNNFPTAAGLASSAAGYACLGGCPPEPQGPRGCAAAGGASRARSLQGPECSNLPGALCVGSSRLYVSETHLELAQA